MKLRDRFDMLRDRFRIAASQRWLAIHVDDDAVDVSWHRLAPPAAHGARVAVEGRAALPALAGAGASACVAGVTGRAVDDLLRRILEARLGDAFLRWRDSPGTAGQYLRLVDAGRSTVKEQFKGDGEDEHHH
jgi:hypothetical protein